MNVYKLVATILVRAERALPLAAGINVGGHYFGRSGVRALPLATILGNFLLFFWSECVACASEAT